MYLRICVSLNPYFARSQGHHATVAASEIMIGMPFMSASFFTSGLGWVISTCGSFWNTAITALMPPFSLTRLKAMKPFEPIPKSAAPPASICGTFTAGPPSRIVTSRPAFL